MDRMHTGKGVLLFIVVLHVVAFFYAVPVLGAVAVLSYTGRSDDIAGLVIENSTLTQEDYGQIVFLGADDKEEGLETPNLYAYEGVGIVPGPECNSVSLQEEAPAKIGQDYCVSASGKEYALKVLALADDWSNITLEWVPSESEGEGSAAVQDFGDDDSSEASSEEKQGLMKFQIAFAGLLAVLLAFFLYASRNART